MNEKLIVILGATAAGKTELSIRLAKAFDTFIISGDSMLVYRGFDIGAAKPDEAGRGGIRHALVDILDPSEKFSVSDFQRLAAKEIHSANEAGKIPIIVGGTGLYLKALLEGYKFGNFSSDDALRHELENTADVYGNEHLHARLEKIDPATAARIHKNDRRRIIRAIEVWESGREKISREKSGLVYNALVIEIAWERRALYGRIDKRVDEMVAKGLFDEVRALLASGVPRDAQPMQGIGYKETASFLAGEITEEEAINDIKKSTRHFAKRQLTWFRKMPYITRVEADNLTPNELFEKVLCDVEGFLSKR